MYHSNDCVENFIEHIEDQVKQLYATFPGPLVNEQTDVLEKVPQAAETYNTVLKSLITLIINR